MKDPVAWGTVSATAPSFPFKFVVTPPKRGATGGGGLILEWASMAVLTWPRPSLNLAATCLNFRLIVGLAMVSTFVTTPLSDFEAHTAPYRLFHSLSCVMKVPLATTSVPTIKRGSTMMKVFVEVGCCCFSKWSFFDGKWP
jgi:hypothetical protein